MVFMAQLLVDEDTMYNEKYYILKEKGGTQYPFPNFLTSKK